MKYTKENKEEILRILKVKNHTVVIINNQTEFNNVTKILSDLGFKWSDDSEYKPSDYEYYNPKGLLITNGTFILTTYCYDTIISTQEFLDLHKEEPIIWCCHGNKKRAKDIREWFKSKGARVLYKCNDKNELYFINENNGISFKKRNDLDTQLKGFTKLKDIPVYQKKVNLREILKPFDKVLIRDCDDEKWCCGHYSHYDKDDYISFATTSNSNWVQCIPYEGNEELV